MAERDCSCALVADELGQHFVVGIRPQVLVVVGRIGVHDEQLIVVFANSNGKWKIGEP